MWLSHNSFAFLHFTLPDGKMSTASVEARMQAEATLKAACLRAATELIIAGKLSAPDDAPVERSVASAAMNIWNSLEKPDEQPASR